MASGQHNFQIETLEVPLPQDAIDELFALWDRFFERRDEDFRDVYTGNETEHNRDIVYVIRRDARLVGTVHLTISKTGPRLGGLGGVATDPEFRGQGMASTLCARAAEGFREAGGQALFLGTNNPAAFRVYRRCGWRRLPSTNVMVLTTTDASPEEFLADHFSEWAPATPAEASPGMRLPMVPLIVAPHNWEALDANVGILSTRYALQRSCMGLYPRYDRLLEDGRGAWFGASTEDGRLVGLATARLTDSGECRVDGFTHERFPDPWKPLMNLTLDWAVRQDASACVAELSIEDDEKLAAFSALGFRQTDTGAGFQLTDREVPSFMLRREV